MLRPQGVWNQLGIHTLVIQYGSVGGKAWFRNAYLNPMHQQPDWGRIRRQPWARGVIMGLAGNFSEPTARANMADLARMSALLAQKTPLPVVGYYFPIEADPTWGDVSQLGAALAGLPKPLWVSIYTRQPITPRALTDWLQSWLPDDVGVMLQDGVGVGDRSPKQAQALLRGLQQSLGKQRVAMIAETFSQSADGDLHQASVWRIIEQLEAYRHDRVYLYDLSHLPNWQVWLIKLWFKL